MNIAARHHHFAFCRYASTMLLLVWGTLATAGESVAVAVASNFAPAARDLTAAFEQQSDIAVKISAASTGKLYAQISNGAPFDVFLAADAERPAMLEEAGLAITGSRFTYAQGNLVLWSRDPAPKNKDCRERLERLGGRRLAIANPVTAPYGLAAQQTLENLGLWERVEPQLVMGENIAQTLHFVSSGNASLGFIAAAQALDARLPEASCAWAVPTDLHEPIAQQAVLLARGESPAAIAFLKFLKSPAGLSIIEQHGYTLPE
jgi:molybdate transport system substrate-binding protein